MIKSNRNQWVRITRKGIQSDNNRGPYDFPQCDELSKAEFKLADGAVGSQVMFKMKAVASDVP